MDGPEGQQNLAESLLAREGGNEVVDLTSAGDIIVDPFQAADHEHRGEHQTPQYRDVPFAVLFLVHLAIIVTLALAWGVGSLKQGGRSSSGENEEVFVNLSGPLWLCLCTSFVSVGISAVSLELITRHAEGLIQASLIASCGSLGCISFMLFASSATSAGFAMLFVFILTALYVQAVWHRIAFSAANMKTALAAIRTNYGVCMLAYAIAFVANIWMFIWLLAFLGVQYRNATCVDGLCSSHTKFISTILMLVSYFWTSQVLQNVLHVTIAGVVGTWWFAPQDANSIFSPAISESFRRATSYSFGSICMGSLLVAVIQALEQMVRGARGSRTGGILLCILECMLFYLQRIAAYFNKYAFVYCGLYGYDYLTAGEKVMSLFHARGWTMIISDNLVHRTLVLVCFVASGITGLVGMSVAKYTGWLSGIVGGDSIAAVFLFCFVVSLSLASILMRVVLSAVDTVIVTFAEAPAEFESNHPALSQQLKTAWHQVYPDECVL